MPRHSNYPTDSSSPDTELPEPAADHCARDLPPVHPLIAQGQETYYRDLPDLLKTHYWEWVAYSGDRCLGFAHTETELYQRCVRQGHKPGEFVVLSIDYYALNENDEMDPPWV